MVMSILHRLTGAALYFGTLLLAAWLIAAAMGEAPFALVNALFAHPIGKLVLFGYTWALAHHMLGGMRHLIWDTGRGLQIWQVNVLSLADDHRLGRPDAGDLGRRACSREGCDMAYRTPLARVRGLGSAKSGAEHFWKQRLTAVANLILVAFLIWLLVEARRRRPRHRQAHAGPAATTPSRCCCWCCPASSTCG